MPANLFAAIRPHDVVANHAGEFIRPYSPHVVAANHAAEFIRRYPPLVVAMNHAAEFIRHCLYVIFFGIIQPYCLYIVFQISYFIFTHCFCFTYIFIKDIFL